MLEPAVTLTDFGLFVICAWFAWRLRGPSSLLRRNFIEFFAAIGATALFGALAHGFFPSSTTIGVVVWRATMLALGVVGASGFLIAIQLLLPAAKMTPFRFFAVAAFVIYAVVVIFVNWDFAVGVAFYVPAAVLMLGGFARQLTRNRQAGMLGSAGMLLTFAAAYIQQAQVALHARYFDHNATYHLVQAAGLLLIYLAARRLLDAATPAE